MNFHLTDIDIRVIDQRIGVGVGGMDTVVRVYHKPTGLLVEVPRLGRGTQSLQRTIALEMIEWALARIAE